MNLTLTLAVADRSLMSPEQWRVFSGTGTGHLLAISGLHIGFAGLLGYRLGWLLMLPVGGRWRMRLGSVPGWICALALASLYLPWSPAALVWPHEWIIVISWCVLGLLFHWFSHAD